MKQWISGDRFERSNDLFTIVIRRCGTPSQHFKYVMCDEDGECELE